MIQVMRIFAVENLTTMTQLQKYTWMIEVIRRTGKITYSDLSNRWERNTDLSEGEPLHRATFNRWRETIFSQFGVNIACQRTGGYLYYIENPENIDDDQLKKWMLDTFAAGNLISENLHLKERILVGDIPSGRDYLTDILEAMKDNRVINITYHPYNKQEASTFPIEPYCVKLFENRWYVLGYTKKHRELRTYALDRMENLEIWDERFVLPKNFSASRFFEPYYGIYTDRKIKPVRVVVRSIWENAPYMKSLPLHHSQCVIEEIPEKYTDFEFYLAPTYDFVMKLMQYGDFLTVLEPKSLRQTMKDTVANMAKMYRK